MRGDPIELQETVFRAIERAAKANAPCPSNRELAALVGRKSTGWASALVFALEADGRIAVERFGSARRVTIAATGQATFYDDARRTMKAVRIVQPALPGPKKPPDPPLAPHHGQSRAEQIRAECAAEAAARLDRKWAVSSTSTLTSVNRGSVLDSGGGLPEVRGKPCFRCGARGACDHRDEEVVIYG